jgi:multiple sugar transport system permease protein
MLKNYNLTTKISRVIVYIFLVILLLITVAPIWLLIVNATRTTTQIQQGISIIPSTHIIDNYNILDGKGLNLPRGFLNSMFLSVSTTFLTVYFAFLAAYGVVVFNFRWKKAFAGFIVVLVLLPTQLSIIGYFQYMSRLGLTDNYIPLILPAIASAFAVFFGIQYLESIVIHDLVDAGRVDGASELGIFHRIMMPIAMPGAVTLAIFTFVGSWNNFFTPFIMISSIEKYTLPMLVQLLRGDVYRQEYGAIYLGLAITAIPVIIIYTFFSKYIISGISMGSVKE